MEAIILAGGLGTRLREVVPDSPKPMAPIGGRPFLEILLTSLARKGIKRVVLSLGYMAEKISNYFGDSFAAMELNYIVEKAPLGTGGAVRIAMTRCDLDHVFVFNGDTFLDLEVDAVEMHWQKHRRPIIVGCEVPDTARYGRLLVEHDQVTGFIAKGVFGHGLISAGCYIFNRGQLDNIALKKVFSLEADYLTQEVTKIRFDMFFTQGKFIDIGVPEDYARAQIDLVNIGL